MHPIDGVFINNPDYIERVNKCIVVFNKLKTGLTTEQKDLLFKYKEETARILKKRHDVKHYIHFYFFDIPLDLKDGF